MSYIFVHVKQLCTVIIYIYIYIYIYMVVGKKKWVLIFFTKDGVDCV